MTKLKSRFEYPLKDLSGTYRYRILADRHTKLKILDKKRNKISFVDFIDLVFNGTFRHFSPDDILRLGYIIGQESMR